MMIRRKATLFFVLFCICFSLCSIPLQAESATHNNEGKWQQIDEYVTSQMQSAHIPGLALGIVHGNQIVHTAGFGTTGASGQPVTPQTPFILGSTSKSFTALAVMQLVEAGQIDLDAPIQTYIPYISIRPTQDASRVTVKDLLNQTSGIPKSADWQNVTLISSHIGTVFEYSNANYELLGQIIASVTKKSYGAYIQQSLFTPLVMNHSFVSQTDAEKNGLATGYRNWYGFNVSAHMPYPQDAIPAGFIISSAEDMSHYLVAQMNSGQYKTTRLVSNASVVKMHTASIKAPMLGPESYYGMGWFIVPTDGIPTLRHAGEVPNYHSTMIIMPHEQYGVVLLTNVNNEILTSSLIEQIGDGIVSLLAGKQPRTISGSTFDTTYGVLDLILLSILSFSAFPVLRLKKWQGRLHAFQRVTLKNAMHLLIIHFLLPLLTLVLLPHQIQMPWSFLFDFAPDISSVVCCSAFLLLAVGVMKLLFVLHLYSKHDRKHSVSV